MHFGSLSDKLLSDHFLRSEHRGHMIFRKFDAAHIIAQAKLHYIERVQMDHEHPSLKWYVNLHEEYSYAAYLSDMKCCLTGGWPKLLSKFRRGCGVDRRVLQECKRTRANSSFDWTGIYKLTR